MIKLHSRINDAEDLYNEIIQQHETETEEDQARQSEHKSWMIDCLAHETELYKTVLQNVQIRPNLFLTLVRQKYELIARILQFHYGLEKEAQDLFLSVCSETQDIQYWTYTKNGDAENGPLADLQNVNIVKSITPDGRVNFGKCGDVARLYRSMKAAGYKVYLCPCGIDKGHDVKCEDCRICAEYDYVLFVMHSVKEYDPKKDPDLHMVYEILDEQNAGR